MNKQKNTVDLAGKPVTAAAPRLWIAMVDHKYVPGTRLALFHQVAEPLDEEIFARFAEDAEAEELTVAGLFDFAHELMVCPESARALTQFMDAWIRTGNEVNSTRSCEATAVVSG